MGGSAWPPYRDVDGFVVVVQHPVRIGSIGIKYFSADYPASKFAYPVIILCLKSLTLSNAREWNGFKVMLLQYLFADHSTTP